MKAQLTDIITDALGPTHEPPEALLQQIRAQAYIVMLHKQRTRWVRRVSLAATAAVVALIAGMILLPNQTTHSPQDNLRTLMVLSSDMDETRDPTDNLVEDFLAYQEFDSDVILF